MIILCGKTCAGKDTIQKELIKMGYKSVISYTTRPPRKGEIDGIAYHFITKEDFIFKKDNGFFAETTSYDVANGETWYYGSAINDLTDDKVIIMNPEGIKKIKEILTLNPIVFYVNVSEQILRERLSSRGDNPMESKRRLEADNNDFANIESLYDYQISGTDKPENLAKLIDFIITNKHKE